MSRIYNPSTESFFIIPDNNSTIDVLRPQTSGFNFSTGRIQNVPLQTRTSGSVRNKILNIATGQYETNDSEHGHY